MSQPVNVEPLASKIVNYSNATTSSINTWSLAIPSNSMRVKWLIQNVDVSPIEIGISDSLGNVSRVFVLTSGQQQTSDNIITTDSLFVRSGAASQNFSALEYIK